MSDDLPSREELARSIRAAFESVVPENMRPKDVPEKYTVATPSEFNQRVSRARVGSFLRRRAKKQQPDTPIFLNPHASISPALPPHTSSPKVTDMPTVAHDPIPHPYLEWFRKEVTKVVRSWYSFFVCLASLALLSAYLANGYYKEYYRDLYQAEIRAKDAELLVKEATIQKLLLRPDTVSEEAEWAPLSDQQISEWVAALENTGLKTITVFWGQDVGARRFFLSLQQVGKRLKIEVKAGSGNADAPEIDIEAAPNEPSRPVLTALFRKLLMGTGYPIVVQPDKMPPPIRPPNGNIMIFIGEKT